MLGLWIFIVVLSWAHGALVPSPLNAAKSVLLGPILTREDDMSPIMGYDCNQTEPEIMSISALDVGPCPDVASFSPVTETEIGQLVQKRVLTPLHIQTCQVIVSTSYFRCGKNWLNYQVSPPTVGFVERIDDAECQQIHSTKEFYPYPQKQAPLRINMNHTHYLSINFVGWTDDTGYCQGGDYQINGVIHHDVVVQKSFSVSIRESWAILDYESNFLSIEGALKCDYKRGSCHDSKSGTHVWVKKEENCEKDKYKLLYKGRANITSSSESDIRLLSISNSPFLFTSELGLKAYTCGFSYVMTEFPDVFWIPQQHNSYVLDITSTETIDIKLITFLNAKLTFTYHNLMSSAKEMYLSSLHHTCMVEREMLKNRIEIIRLNSLSGGLSSLLKPGMFAKVNGEVIHLIKCKPSAVQFRKTEFCYDALPVVLQGRHMFLMPNTHILSLYASIIPCSPITPLTYRIGNAWWAFTGEFLPVQNPHIIAPVAGIPDKFNTIRSFASGGMYPQDQVEAVQKLLVFPSLRESITTDIVEGVTKFHGRPVVMDITPLMSEMDWKTLAKKRIEAVWGVFAKIGTAVSGLIGIYFVVKCIIGVFNCIIDGKELYKMFGCSLYLLSSVWSRLAIYFLNKAREQTQTTQTSSQDEAMEMTPITGETCENDPTAPPRENVYAEAEVHQARYTSVYPEC